MQTSCLSGVTDKASGDDEDEEGEAEEMTDDTVEQPTTALPTLTTVQLYAVRRQKLAERKTQIANAASSLLEDPEENVSKTFPQHFVIIDKIVVRINDACYYELKRIPHEIR